MVVGSPDEPPLDQNKDKEALNNPRKSESWLIKVHQMKSSSSDSPISRTLRPLVGLLGSSFGHLPTLQAHSSCRPLNHSFSHHPQVAQRKQCDQLRRVFDQVPIPSLAIAKLALDHPQEVRHFGPNAGLDLLQLVDQGVYSFALLQSQSDLRSESVICLVNSLSFSVKILSFSSMSWTLSINSRFCGGYSELPLWVIIGKSVSRI